MGYETKLIIGTSSRNSEDEYVYGDFVIENGEPYRPFLKDDNGDVVKTGNRQTYFMVMATVDLCKCGHKSNIHKLDRVNKDESHQWFWYEKNDIVVEDCYGDKMKPVPISDLIEALKLDIANDEYRRFKWALALLESMKGDRENITVMLYGH